MIEESDYAFDDSSYLFTLRLTLESTGEEKSKVVIHAFDAGDMPPNHTRIDVEVSIVRFRGSISIGRRQILFPRGQLYCGLPGRKSIDGAHAKELVLSLVAMKPGDTDADYFADYTAEQHAFAEKYGDTIKCEAMSRYCDPETGEVRS